MSAPFNRSATPSCRGVQLRATEQLDTWQLWSDAAEGGDRPAVVGAPSFDSAQSWRRRLRRIDRVVFRHDGDEWRAAVWGVGHRRSVRCRVSRQTALALALGGVPAAVETDS